MTFVWSSHPAIYEGRGSFLNFRECYWSLGHTCSCSLLIWSIPTSENVHWWPLAIARVDWWFWMLRECYSSLWNIQYFLVAVLGWSEDWWDDARPKIVSCDREKGAVNPGSCRDAAGRSETDFLALVPLPFLEKALSRCIPFVLTRICGGIWTCRGTPDI